MRQNAFDSSPSSVIECPAGTGRFYFVVQVEDVAKGYPNEYRICIVIQAVNVHQGWVFPTP